MGTDGKRATRSDRASRDDGRHLGLRIYSDEADRLVIPYCSTCRPSTTVPCRIELEDALTRDVLTGTLPGVARTALGSCPLAGTYCRDLSLWEAELGLD